MNCICPLYKLGPKHMTMRNYVTWPDQTRTWTHDCEKLHHVTWLNWMSKHVIMGNHVIDHLTSWRVTRTRLGFQNLLEQFWSPRNRIPKERDMPLALNNTIGPCMDPEQTSKEGIMLLAPNNVICCRMTPSVHRPLRTDHPGPHMARCYSVDLRTDPLTLDMARCHSVDLIKWPK